MPSALLPEQHVDAEQATWHLVPRFMLRVGGLPFETADRLTAPRSAAWADEVLDGEARLRADGARLADLLEARVAGHLEDPKARRLLINLRRDVFNGRAPRGLDRAAALLPADEAAALNDWAQARTAHEDLLRAGTDILAEETAGCREELRRITACTDLRLGVQLSSPTLDEHLDAYLGRVAERRLSKRERRMERSLLEYLYRTACKTSPFSTLTSVCVGTLTDGGEAAGSALHVEAENWDKRSTTRLNVAVLSRLSALMADTPAVRGDLPVRATGGLEVHRDRVRYLRRLRDSGDEDAAVTLDTVHENLFYLPTGDLLADVLALLEDDATPRFDDLVARLSDGREDRPADEVAEYVAALLRLGLLVVPGLQLDIHDPDPVAGYRRGLAALHADWADRIGAIVGRLGELVADFAEAGPDRRRDLLAGIAHGVHAAHRVLGREDLPVLRTLVYEDTTLPAARVSADRKRWESDLLPDLRRLAPLMPAFDANEVRRLVTRGFFAIRYGAGGRCDDVLTFAHEFQQDFYDNYNQRLMRHQRFDGQQPQTYDNWFRQPEITGVDAARAQVAAELTRRMADRAAAGAGPGTELGLDDAFLDAVRAHLPQPDTALRSLSFFLQLADDGATSRAVVNRVYSGLTLLFSRFAHLFDARLPDALRAALDQQVPEGAVFAELRGGYDATNLNLHPVVTRYELVCPGETSFRPADEQIPVEDLVIEHDAAADRLLLRSRRLGVEVVPVYLGFLLPMALPEVQQVLLNFSPTTMVQLDLWSGTGLAGETATALPRITLGNLVLQRRTWRVPPTELPEHATGADDAERWLTWRRWQRARGLPRRVFAALGGEHKPQYVDFDSQMCVNLLETAVRGTTATVVFSEMLPGPGEQAVHGDGQARVSELTVELGATAPRTPQRTER
jgi:lantibiotic biosynthesis dehydratase-like protein